MTEKERIEGKGERRGRDVKRMKGKSERVRVDNWIGEFEGSEERKSGGMKDEKMQSVRRNVIK